MDRLIFPLNPGVMASKMARENHKSLTFTVTRCEPELVRPSKPTPSEFKRLSDIDDQQGLWIHVPMILFYPRNPLMREMDPVTAIRRGLVEALVYYYPLTGRLREWPGPKLVVDCRGDGILFIEADADVTLDRFGDPIIPPFPCMDELLFDVVGSSDILDSPLLLFQVTRLRCGGFILGLRFNHTMCDGIGLIQFVTAVMEMANGASAPSIIPVWKRELLEAREPLRITCVHREYDKVAEDDGTISPLHDMSQRYFMFGSSEISAIRLLVPSLLRGSFSTFEVLTAFLWHCRTAALGLPPDDEVRVMMTFNARAKFNPPLPRGYYGNVIATPVAIARVGDLCTRPLGFALELIKKAKMAVTEEYMRSLMDHIVARGRPLTLAKSFLVSDITQIGAREIDGLGIRAKYSGLANTAFSIYIPVKNEVGEDAIIVPINLPAAAMKRFDEVLHIMLGKEAKKIVSPL